MADTLSQRRLVGQLLMRSSQGDQVRVRCAQQGFPLGTAL